MASENNNFQSTVNSLFKGMDSFITTKTVVGDAITVGKSKGKLTCYKLSIFKRSEEHTSELQSH